MRSLAYNKGVQQACYEAGYSSLSEFAKHSAELDPAMIEQLQGVLHHQDKMREVSQEASSLPLPESQGLLASIKRLFSTEANVPGRAQAFLDMVNPDHTNNIMRMHPGKSPGEFVLRHLERSSPSSDYSVVNLNMDALNSPKAESWMNEYRDKTVPPWMLGGGLVGGAIGAGIGHFTSPDDATMEDQARRALIGSGVGAGVGALGGGLLGYLRGGMLGKATTLGLDIANRATQNLGQI